MAPAARDRDSDFARDPDLTRCAHGLERAGGASSWFGYPLRILPGAPVDRNTLVQRLDDRKIGFITLRARTPKLTAHLHQLPPDAWTAIERSVRRIAERQATNKLLSAALGLISERRDVVMALGELSLAWQQLIDRAREDGTVRSDATVKDLRFVFAAARAADEVEPGGRDRILTLLLEALRR